MSDIKGASPPSNAIWDPSRHVNDPLGRSTRHVMTTQQGGREGGCGGVGGGGVTASERPTWFPYSGVGGWWGSWWCMEHERIL